MVADVERDGPLETSVLAQAVPYKAAPNAGVATSTCARCGRQEVAACRAPAFPDVPVPWGWAITPLGQVCERCNGRPAPRPSEACRRCSECRGENHHWLEESRPPPPNGDGFNGYVCKHCEATAEMCDDCTGAVEPGHVCEDDEDEVPATHRAVQSLLFAMRIYPGYKVESRGPSGCILDAIEVLEPEVAAKIRDGVDPGDLLDPDTDDAYASGDDDGEPHPTADSSVVASEWAVDYDALDPGIRSAVRWLVRHGFHPTDSGDGVSKAELIRDGYAEDVPHVYMLVEPEHMVAEARRLRMVLEANGADLTNGTVMIETSFSPLDKVAILTLRGLDDRATPFTREAGK